MLVCLSVYVRASDTLMPFENPAVQSSVRTTIVMFHRLDSLVKPTDVCTLPVVLIGGFALGYPTRNPGKTQIRF